MSFFITTPAFAFVPVLLFIAAYIHHRVLGGRGFQFARFVLLAAGCVWLLYALYEFSVQRELKPESVPIRVDLEFIGPADQHFSLPQPLEWLLTCLAFRAGCDRVHSHDNPA
jgi:hypothetical protein